VLRLLSLHLGKRAEKVVVDTNILSVDFAILSNIHKSSEWQSFFPQTMSLSKGVKCTRITYT